MYKPLTCLIVFGLMLMSCHRVKPQGAANAPKVDSTEVLTTLANMRLAEASDEQCTRWVLRSGLPFVQHSEGFWYLLTRRCSGDSIHEGDAIRLRMLTYRPDSTLIEDSDLRIRAGKREVLRAVDELLPSLLTGDEVVIICPFYLAYGLGQANMQDAHSCCRIELKNIQKQ